MKASTNPVYIKIEIDVLATYANGRSKVRHTFLAAFEGGAVERITKTKKMATDLLCAHEVKNGIVCHPDECALFYNDNWAKWGDAVTINS